MLLAIDVGNSQTSYGVFQKNGSLLHHWRSETKVSRTTEEYASFLFPLLDFAKVAKNEWDGVAICSVVPPVDHALTDFSEQYLGKTPFKVTHQIDLGFSFNVEVPHEVGADRLANAAYAVRFLKLPTIVVDLGTATTFDVITSDRKYQGGIILPGVRMGAESLSSRTSLLPRVDVAFPPSVIGKNTTTCIQSGVLWGYTDAIDGLLRRLLKEVPGAGVVLTGGVAPLFHGKLSVPSELLPNLTLEGIQILFQKNRG